MNLIEENTSIVADELLKRKSIFRVFYIFLFCKQSNFLTMFASLHKKQFVSICSYTVNSTLSRKNTIASNEPLFNQNFPTQNLYSTLIEQRVHTPKKFKNIDNVYAHPFLPVICQVEESELFFVYTKTLTVVNSVTLVKSKKIKHFLFNRTAYWFLVIDGLLLAHVYKFTVDFSKVELIKSFEGVKAYQGVFFNKSSSLLLTTSNQEFIIYDFVWNKIKVVEYPSANLIKTKLEYIESLNSILMVVKNKGLIWMIETSDFAKKKELNLNAEEISCFYVHNSMLLVGFTAGGLKVYSLTKMNLIFEQSFGEQDGKKIHVEEMTVCSDFVIAGLSSGTV